MSATTSITITQLYPQGPTLGTMTVGADPIFLKAVPLDASGSASGANVVWTTSNANVAAPTTATQIGNAPMGVKGIGSGTATLTATPQDATSLSATTVITVQ